MPASRGYTGGFAAGPRLPLPPSLSPVTPLWMQRSCTRTSASLFKSPKLPAKTFSLSAPQSTTSTDNSCSKGEPSLPDPLV
jgi:hypothetical protein